MATKASHVRSRLRVLGVGRAQDLPGVSRGWRATFYVGGMEHSLTSTVGSAFEPTPWKAVQGVAARTLDKIERAR